MTTTPVSGLGFFQNAFAADPDHPGFYLPGSAGASPTPTLGIARPVPNRQHVILGDFDFDAPGATEGVAGVSIRRLKLQGWDGKPASTRELTQRRRAPGAWSSTKPQVTPRPITISGVIDGPTSAAVQTVLELIDEAASLEDTFLVVDDGPMATSADGTSVVGPRFCLVARAGEILVESDQRITRKTFSIALVAAEPRKFANALTDRTGLPAAIGGLTWPTTWPQAWTGQSVSGRVQLTNPGRTRGPVNARVIGPLPDFAITHVGSSGPQTVAMGGLSLAAGEFVDVWMENEVVLALGDPQASRSQWLTSRGWSGFDPGPNSWTFTSSGPATVAGQSAQLIVTATPAWL